MNRPTDGDRYDLIVVGTGFASAFFLLRYLDRASPSVRVLVLERGAADPKDWQLAHRRASSIAPSEVFRNRTPDKEWLTSPGFGGNSKCWWGGAARVMPADLQLRTRYGVGVDWPVTYEELAAHYDVAEALLQVSGPAHSPMPRSGPYPLPPHRLSDPDERLRAHFPNGWFAPATARASIAVRGRAACCATGVCELCPVDAKATVQNSLSHVFEDPRVTLRLQSPVQRIETSGGLASGVVFVSDGREQRAGADLVVLAASALFNPHLLLRSDIAHPLTGKFLHEQLPVDVCLDLRGVKAFNGSTSICGNGYLFYDGEHRRDHAGCLIETWNTPFAVGPLPLRSEQGRWTERLYLRFAFDEIPREDNAVTVCAEDPALAETRFGGWSDYAERGARRIPAMIDTLAAALPIERIISIKSASTAAHIQGTVVMGHDPATSVVDRGLVHHRCRNLLVLGSSAFPTATPTYPTLTICALSLLAADRLTRSAS